MPRSRRRSDSLDAVVFVTASCPARRQCACDASRILTESSQVRKRSESERPGDGCAHKRHKPVGRALCAPRAAAVAVDKITYTGVYLRLDVTHRVGCKARAVSRALPQPKVSFLLTVCVLRRDSVRTSYARLSDLAFPSFSSPLGVVFHEHVSRAKAHCSLAGGSGRGRVLADSIHPTGRARIGDWRRGRHAGCKAAKYQFQGCR